MRTLIPFLLSLVLMASCEVPAGQRAYQQAVIDNASKEKREKARLEETFALQPNSKEYWIVKWTKETRRADSLQELVDKYEVMLGEDSIDGMY